ncbi:MAG: acyl carrier protein [Candidatus Aminicenantes bacterium]|nr:acyl carrier protein [Candidatus Aminicenantes bacterium]
MDDTIKAILAEILEVRAEEIGDDFGPDRCRNWDSLSNLRIVTALEKAFRLTLTWAEISSMTDVRRIRDVIGRRLEGR